MTFPAPRCSLPGCDETASIKVAAPWSYGTFNELKTYGYACEAHAQQALEHAEARPKPPFLAAGESMGGIQAYKLKPRT